MLVYVCFKYFSQLLLLKFHRRSELNTFTWEKPFESNNSLLKKEKTISSNLKSSQFVLVKEVLEWRVKALFKKKFSIREATSHVRTAGCICLHTNGMTHVHPWDEQTWIKIQTFLPPEMYILRMYGIRTLCTFLVCTKELFLVCTNMYRTSKCWFKLHLYLYYVTFRLIPFSLAL